MLARAVGDRLSPYMIRVDDSLLDRMFSNGLGKLLVVSLSEISRAIPTLLTVIQHRVMHEISLILTGQSFSDSVSDALGGGARARSDTGKGGGGGGSSGSASSSWNLFRGAIRKAISSATSSSGSRDGAGGTGSGVDTSLTLLALETLGAFDLSGMEADLLPFVRFGVLGYLDHDTADIRRHAAMTWCQRSAKR